MKSLKEPKRSKVRGEFAFGGAYDVEEAQSFFEEHGSKIAEAARKVQGTASTANGILLKGQDLCTVLYDRLNESEKGSYEAKTPKKLLKNVARELGGSATKKVSSAKKATPKKGTPSKSPRR